MQGMVVCMVDHIFGINYTFIKTLWHELSYEIVIDNDLWDFKVES